MTDILQFTRLPWLSIFNAASQARKQTVQRLLRFSFLKNTVALPCNSQFASKMAPTMIFRVQGASPLPGSFLVPRSMAGKGVSWPLTLTSYSICHFTASAGLFVLYWKVNFPRKFGTLHNIDLLQLPQTPSKFNLANKKDQVSFSSDRDNVNASQYCTENKQALPQTPHWSPTSITVLVYNAVGVSCNPQNSILRRPWFAASDP